MAGRRFGFSLSVLAALLFLSCPNPFKPFTPPEGTYQEPELLLPSFADPLLPEYQISSFDTGRIYAGIAFHEGKLSSLSFLPSPATEKESLIQVYDADTGILTQTIDLKAKSSVNFSAYDIAFHGTEALVISPGSIYRFSIADWSYLGSYDPQVTASHQGIAVSGDIAYISAYQDRSIWRFDLASPATAATALATLPEGASPRGMAAADGILYVADSFHNAIYRIDASTGAILGQIGVDLREEMGLGISSGYLYMRLTGQAAIRPLHWQAIPSPAGSSCAIIRSDPLDATITFTATVQNSGLLPARVKVRAALPRSDAHQEILGLSYQGSMAEGQDIYGQGYAVLTSEDIPAYGSATLSYTADARLWTVKYHLDDDFTASLSALPEPEKGFFLTDSFSYLSMGSSAVRSFADAVPGSTENFPVFGRSVRNSVFNALEYNLDNVWDDAATVLARGSGSCSEYSFVTSAVWRLRGYPTRFVGASTGRDAYETGTHVDEVYHRWIEVFVPGAGWVPMDCNHNDSDSGPPYCEEQVYGVDRFKLIVLKGGCEDADWLGRGYISDYSLLSGAASVSASFQWEL